MGIHVLTGYNSRNPVPTACVTDHNPNYCMFH